MTPSEEDKKAAIEFVRAAGELSGETTSAAIGLLVGGAPGAIGGAIAGSLLKVAADFAQRELSKRQRDRAGTALAVAADRAWHRVMAGDEIREDDFFTLRGDGTSSAEEVAEAVLIAVRDESEQRKVPYMGYLIANIGFEPTVGSRSAHDLVAEAEGLTYTQFVLLAAVARKDEIPLPPRRGGIPDSLEARTVLSQFDNLGYARRELIGVEPPKKGLPTNLGVPADQVLRDRGAVLHSLLELCRIPIEEIDAVVGLLWSSGLGRPEL